MTSEDLTLLHSILTLLHSIAFSTTYNFMDVPLAVPLALLTEFPNMLLYFTRNWVS